MMKKLSLKKFITELSSRLEKLPYDELRAIILHHAETLSPVEREPFLDIFKGSERRREQKPVRTEADYLLKEIDVFGKWVENYEYTDGWGWDHELRDERAWGDENWVYEVDGLFEEIDKLYEAGDYSLARKAYEQLLGVYHGAVEDGQLAGYEHDEMLRSDLEEISLKYLRCIYLTEKSASRPKALFGAISSTYYNISLTLEGIINVSLEDLPDLDRFGRDWTAYLQKRKGDALATRLLKEAIGLFQGIEGLEALAREHGREYPGAFVEWLDALKEKRLYEDMVRAAELGLETLPDSFAIRARIADYLYSAARELKQEDLVKFALKEALYSAPSLARILNLLDSAESQEQRTTLIDEALSRFGEIQGRKGRSRTTAWTIGRSPDLDENYVPENLEMYCHLLRGDYSKVFSLIGKSKPLGWSHGESPNFLAVPFFLFAGWNKDQPLTPNMADLWNQATLVHTMIHDDWEFDDYHEELESRDLGSRFRTYLENVLTDQTIAEKDLKRYFHSAEKAARKRVDAIVSNKFRTSYWKAAQLILAIAETYWSNGKLVEGQKLIDHFRGKYNRHSAFKSELKGMAAKSRLFSVR
ncbi:MAG: hypothetical protein JSU72_14535 [Deltaproteobacteria bacterium]|nr:MAG: hypothetical protein JSU72_14535 [Deltaproteobacteria bacterium]